MVAKWLQPPTTTGDRPRPHTAMENGGNLRRMAKSRRKQRLITTAVLGAEHAHNLKVVGSNPTPATNNINDLAALRGGFFLSGCKLVAKIVITAGMPHFLTVVF